MKDLQYLKQAYNAQIQRRSHKTESRVETEYADIEQIRQFGLSRLSQLVITLAAYCRITRQVDSL